MKRIGNSFKGILGGIVVIIIGVCLLWWNEGNNVKNLKTTAEMDKTVIDVKSDSIDSKNDGKLIATSGKLINEKELTDSKFGVTVKTPILKRLVEVYQWDEESHTDDDGDTTYSYEKKWSSDIIDSSDFHNAGHDNPKSKLYEDEVYTSDDVKVGAFSLSSNQINTLSTKGNFTDFNEETLNTLNLKVSSTYATNSEDLDNPKVGDVRISFIYNNSSDVSVLAVQSGKTFTDFVSSAGKTVNRVMDGTHSGSEMINVIKSENNFLKWILRLVGTLLCVIGFGAILKPISAITSFVPILGSIVGAAVGLVSFVLGLCLSLIVIAIAWIRFRPILGICLLAIVGVLVVFLITRGKKTKNDEGQQAVDANQEQMQQPVVNNIEQQAENVQQTQQTFEQPMVNNAEQSVDNTQPIDPNQNNQQ